MTKTNVAKLKRLADAITRHEEAVEKNFTPKQVAIVKTRCGLKGGKLLTAKETAKKMKLSESYVNQVQREVTHFVAELDKDIPAQVRETRAQKSKQLAFTGSIDLKTGKVEVKGAKPKEVHEMREALVQVVRHAEITYVPHLHRMASGAAADAGNKASGKFQWSFLSAVAAVALFVLSVSPNAQDTEHAPLVLTGVSLVFALLALKKFYAGVKYLGERRGLLRVREL